MTTFGFSAYLKLICSSPKAQNAIIRERVFPTPDSYDFHRSLRFLARRLCTEGESVDLLLTEADKIKREPERKSAKEGIASLAKWISKHKPEIVQVGSVQITNLASHFRVSYAPDFGIKTERGVTAIHLWNTKRPPLDRRFVVGALSLVSNAFSEEKGIPLNAAVLSLQDNAFYSSDDANSGTMKLAIAMIAAIDAIFQEIKDGGGKGKKPSIPPYVPPPF